MEYLIKIQVPFELSQSGAEYLRDHIDVLLEFLYGNGNADAKVTAILQYD